MIWIAAVIGAATAYVGAALSAVVSDLPTGAVIVILQGAAFAVSMVAAPGRGAISSFLRVRRDRRDYAAGVLPAEAGLTLPEKRP